MLYFSADQHITKYMKDIHENGRPFRSASEHTDAIIAGINSVCSYTDELLILGDFVNYKDWDRDSWKDGLAVVSELMPECSLVLGNNEKRILNEEGVSFGVFSTMCYKLGWRRIYYDYSNTIPVGGRLWSVAHNPCDIDRNYLGLFGHVHRFGPITGIGINVGVDVNHFRPLGENDISLALHVVSSFVQYDEATKLLVGGEFSKNW